MNKANICREWVSEPRLVMIINNIVFNQISFKLNTNCFFRYFRNNIRNAHRSVVPNIKVTVLLIYNGLTLAVITPSGTQFSKIDMFTKKVHITGIFKKSAPSFRNLAGISSTLGQCFYKDLVAWVLTAQTLQIHVHALNEMFPFLIYFYFRNPSNWQCYYHVSSFLMKFLNKVCCNCVKKSLK